LTYVIFSPCIDTKNKSCVDVCPVSCIYIESDDLDRMLYINPDECIDCARSARFSRPMQSHPNGRSMSS
jgi:NAD-dependent dihydropyrimidine dehydrogenase PreA subunit